MKRISFIILAIVGSLFFHSCNESVAPNAEGFKEMSEIFKSKFGADAHYTQLMIVNGGKSAGYIFNATATSKPSSLKMEQWGRLKGAWKQTSEVTLEINGGKAEDFMFTFKDINFETFGKAVEEGIKKLKDEKSIDAVIENASIIAPRNGDKSKLTYNFSLKPKKGGTSFRFHYGLDGKLQNFDY